MVHKGFRLHVFYGCVLAPRPGMNTRVLRLIRGLMITGGMLVALLVFSNKVWASGCDLYATNSTCTFNGGIYNVVGPQPTGSGVIDSFLRVQQKGAEEGFNTNARPMLCDGRTCDDKTDLTFTHNLKTSDVPIVNIGGTNYREFF